jgi:hypothetical protein
MCAATIIAADKSLRLVIRFFHLDNKSQTAEVKKRSTDQSNDIFTRFQHRAR